MRTKLLVPHVADCHAVAAVERGDWLSPWWITGERERRDALGGKTRFGSNSWIVLGCNSTQCNAQMLVRENDILAAIEEVPR